MKVSETQIVGKTFNHHYTDTTPISSIEGLNKKVVEAFDANSLINDKAITQIPNRSQSLGVPEIKSQTKINSIDDIYFEPEFTSLEFKTVLRLLAKSVSYCKKSIDEFRQENFIESDTAIHHIQTLLPELFACRNLSESFEAVINSIQMALINNRGMPLSEEKLLALNEILTKIRNEPFMKFNKAIKIIMDFESQDFVVEPIGFDILTELLDA